MRKLLVIGSSSSAPFITKYAHRLYEFFDEIYSINNAWSVLPWINHEWVHSTDFWRLGTKMPNETELSYLHEEDTSTILWTTKTKDKARLTYEVERFGSGTMFFHTVCYAVLRQPPVPLKIYLIGCDFDYERTTTHFYGCGKSTPHTDELIETNAPEYKGKAADPFRYGKQNVVDQLAEWSQNRADIEFYNLSPFGTLLPFPKVPLETLFPEPMIE